MAESRGCRATLEKLKRQAKFAHKSDEELRKLANNLTDFDEVFRRFTHLLQPVVDKAIDEVLIDYRAVFTHSDEVEMSRRRAKHDLALVFHLPVKLFLSRLSQPIPLYSIAGKVSKFFLEYGALHAGLVVGNIRIEWGQESIVEAQPEEDIPGDDFVGTVDGTQGHLAHAAIEIHQKFSLAHRHQRTDDKIKLIIDTAEKKKEVLSNLVRVIVHYNLERRYDLFTCNCQHFVRDALAALGIKEPPRFSGQLNNHLEHLKQGKVEVPEDFKNHVTLDAYVEQQLQAEPGTLNQHDMEYLLLHYYRIHLDSMPEDGTDEWRCGVPSCKYEHLADRVSREALLNNQFPPGSTAQHDFVSSTPKIKEQPANHCPQECVEAARNAGSHETSLHLPDEEVRRREEETRREEQKREQVARDEQRAREMVPDVRQAEVYERHMERGYYTRVVAKLRNIPEYAEASAEEIEEAVANLTECELLRTRYDCFPATVEETSKGYALEVIADREFVEAERLLHDAAKNKVEKRYEKLSELPVKLLFKVRQTELSGVSGIYNAPLDAVLLIWDHILEWNNSSLVIPRRVDLNKLPPTLLTPLLYGSGWSTYISDKRSNMRTVVNSQFDKLHKKEIDLVFNLTCKKDTLIAAVIKVVVDYNRNKQYHERECNNDHFIRDVTSAMGIKKFPEIAESLGKQLEQSRRLCTEMLPRTEFVDHAVLDEYIRECHANNTLSELHMKDVEYLLAKYFHFHVRNWEQSHSPDQWTCPVEDCQLRKLEEHLEKLSLSSDSKCVVL